MMTFATPISTPTQPHSADISENHMRMHIPEILEILLIDRTTSTSETIKNIIWANENYIAYGEQHYAATSPIKIDLITGEHTPHIMPRALKSQELQKERTKSKAEVFTPTWVVKIQNDALDENYADDDLETYIRRKWLEITCGEAPYMTTRYDMETGKLISLAERVGFIDRKLRRINQHIQDKLEWHRMAMLAYQASYGFEWNGDSLLLARENLLYTYRDFYYDKWQEEPLHDLFKDIAEIISYNVFQMDGLKYIIPLSEKREKIIIQQLSLFDERPANEEWRIQAGKRVKIMNWNTKKMEYFDKELKL